MVRVAPHHTTSGAHATSCCLPPPPPSGSLAAASTLAPTDQAAAAVGAPAAGAPAVINTGPQAPAAPPPAYMLKPDCCELSTMPWRRCFTVRGGAALGARLHRHAGGLAQAVAHGELQAHDAGAARCKVVHHAPPPPHHRPARQPLLLSRQSSLW